MDAKSAKKNGESKKANRDDRQTGVKVEESAEKVLLLGDCSRRNEGVSDICVFNQFGFLFGVQLLKSLGITATSEDKIFALAKNHIELERENNRRGSILKLSEKALEKEQREKDHLQKEYNKGVLVRWVFCGRYLGNVTIVYCCMLNCAEIIDAVEFATYSDKLEQVCREQQKLMKSIKSESMSKIRDEEEKRKETQAHFQTSINEIFSTLGKNNDENLKIKEANLEMTKK